MLTRKRDDRLRRDTADNFGELRATLRRLTAGREGGPLRLDGAQLTPEQRVDLAELVGRCWRETTDSEGVVLGRAFEPAQLGRDRGKFETLIEVAAGLPAGTLKRERDDHAADRELAKIAAEVAKPPRRVDLHEEGSVTLPKLIVHDWMSRKQPILTIWQLGFLTLLCSIWENGESCIFGSRIVGVGDDAAIVVHTDYGIGYHLDRERRLDGWRRDLEHLQRNHLIELERKPDGELWITKGSRLRRATKRKAA